MKTLNEVVELVGMTRRMIQEYEKAGLARTPTTTNKYGHLLYDETAIERLWQIRFYRELEYNKEQIKEVFTDPGYNKHDAIADQIIKLEEKKKKLESMIEVARAYNEMDVLPSDVWKGQSNALEYIPYDTWVAFVAKVVEYARNFIEQIDWEKEMPKIFWQKLLVDWPTKEDTNQWVAAVNEIGKCYSEGVPPQSIDVQNQVSAMHRIDARIIPDSIFKCWLRTCTIIKMAGEEAFGKDGYQYMKNAINIYVKDQWMKYVGNIEAFSKTHIWKTIENLQFYGYEYYTTGSQEVQGEIKGLHKMLSDIGIFSEKVQMGILCYISDFLDSQEVKDVIEEGREKGICWFISKAIQVYCNHQQEAMEEKEENNE